MLWSPNQAPPKQLFLGFGPLTSVFAVVVSAITLPMIFLGTDGPPRGLSADAIHLHLPQINHFMTEEVGWFEYHAMAPVLPIYHFIMAGLADLLGLETFDNTALIPRLLHFAMSAAGLVFFMKYVEQSTSRTNALLLMLPTISSWYVLSGLIYFGTDGPGFSLLLMMLVALQTRALPGSYEAVTAFFLAAFRHLYMPAIAGAYGLRFLARPSLSLFIRFSLVFLPSFLLLAVYFYVWGGLTPPTEWLRDSIPLGFYPQSVVGHLGIAGMWGVAFAVLLKDRFIDLLSDPKPLALACGIVSIPVVILWSISETTLSEPGGRFGSVIWRFSEVVAIGDMSLVALGAALVGGWIITAYCVLLLRENQEVVHMGAMVGTILFLGLTYVAFQRYSEPAIVACYALSTVGLLGHQTVQRWQMLPIFGLACVGIATYYAKTIHSWNGPVQLF